MSNKKSNKNKPKKAPVTKKEIIKDKKTIKVNDTNNEKIINEKKQLKQEEKKLKKEIKEVKRNAKKEKKIKEKSKFTTKIKELTIKVKRKYAEIKENPKMYLRHCWKQIKHSVSINRLFLFFIVFNVLNAAMLRAFTLGSETIFDFDPLIADFAFVVLIGSFTYLFNEKGKFIYMAIITTLLSLICVLNSSYYTFYTSFSSISLLSTARFITDVGDAVVENVVEPKDLVFLIMPLALIFLHHRYKKKEKYMNSEFIYKSKTKFFKSLIIGFLSLFLFSTNLTGTDVSSLTKQWNREYIVENFGIYIYHINDLVRSLEPKFVALFGYDSALKEFNDFYKDYEAPKKNEYTGRFEGKNIIVIHGESMQNFLIGLKFNGQEVTPNLNKLAKNGMYFNNFYSQVSVGTSSDTEFTFNTSLMPANIGTAFTDYADKEYISTPKLLKEKGYYTFSMHANNGEYWNRKTMHKNLGYDHFYAKDEYIIDEEIGLGLSDVSFFRQTIEKLKVIKEEHEKFYGTIIMLTNHTPFSATDKYLEYPVDIKETITDENGEKQVVSYPFMEGTKLGNYFKAAHYADYALGEFLQNLEKEGLLENTVLIFYGDHDARLPKGDYVRLLNYDKETDSVYEEDDPRYIEFNSYDYELNRKVPFIIWSKDMEQDSKKYDMGISNNIKMYKEDLYGQEITKQGINYPMGMYDVLPTIGNMFGFTNKYALGHDIFNTKYDNIVIFPTSNWVTKDMYYNSQKEEAYFLSNSVISDTTIKENSVKTDKILSVSNNILVYDLIKNSKIKNVNESDIVEGN